MHTKIPVVPNQFHANIFYTQIRRMAPVFWQKIHTMKKIKKNVSQHLMAFDFSQSSSTPSPQKLFVKKSKIHVQAS